MNTLFEVKKKKFEPGSDFKMGLFNILLVSNGNELMYTIAVPGDGITYDQANERIQKFVIDKVPAGVTDKIAYIDKRNLVKNIPGTGAGKSKNRRYFDMVFQF